VPATPLAALLIDAVTGEPAWLYGRLPHPVVVLGRAVWVLERGLLRPGDGPARQRWRGAALLVLVAGGAAGTGAALAGVLGLVPGGWLVEAAAMSTLLAQRSLVQHVAAVSDGLACSLAEGRRAVARIVGRDPERLDRAGVARAAIESLAENLSDGVTAPLFWGVVAGLPGMLAYKAVNTLDSMVGHKNERYRHFGWASARCDDLANLVPARLTGVLLCLAGGGLRLARPGPALRAMRTDAPRHRSPNAGWPEAAMAAALGLRLNGPRVYDGVLVPDAWLGHGRAEADVADIHRAIRLAWAAWWLMVAGLAAVATVLSLTA
jgi:adenosylcobinamide-phosphate synthase